MKKTHVFAACALCASHLLARPSAHASEMEILDRLVVNGTAQLKSSVTVEGYSMFRGTVSVDGYSILRSSVIVDGYSAFRSTLSVDGYALLLSSVIVDGYAAFRGSTTVDGYAAFRSSVGFDSTGGIVLPKGGTAQRPASPETGTMRYNTTTGRLEYYNGTFWVGLSGFCSTSIASDGAFTQLDGNCIHTFKDSGTFTVKQSRTA